MESKISPRALFTSRDPRDFISLTPDVIIIIIIIDMPIDTCESDDHVEWNRPKEYYDITIEAILEDELFTCPSLMPVVVAKLNGSKQDITRVFKMTKDIASTADLKHLRRIRDTPTGEKECIICCLKELNEGDTQEQRMRELEDRFQVGGLLKDFRVVQVPSQAPRTEQQRDACIKEKLWPCKYAKSAYLTQCIDGSELEQDERQIIDVIANELLMFVNSSENNKTSGAVIYRRNKLGSIGLTNSEIVCQVNPCKHAAMSAIDRLAERHGAGHWKRENLDSWQQETSECQRLEDVIDERLSGLNTSLKNHPDDEGFLPYLCTDNDVILTEEPCMMCTMGLVQSRIKRVFYLNLEGVDEIDKKHLRPVCYPDQAIEKFMVHRVRDLNHHFQAWRIKLI